MARKSKTQTEYSGKPVEIKLYRWGGKWGPFKVKIPCGECALTKDVIDDTLKNELANAKVELTVKDWLSHWWEPVLKGGWHAPIIMVDGEVIAQGAALNRGLLAQEVIERHVQNFAVEGTHLYGKDNCGHCVRAKAYMDRAGIAYTYHDVVKNPGAMYEMIERVKPIVGPKTPITTPQIWIDGEYIMGGADGLRDRLGLKDEVAVDAKKQAARKYWGLPDQGTPVPEAAVSQTRAP